MRASSRHSRQLARSSEDAGPDGPGTKDGRRRDDRRRLIIRVYLRLTALLRKTKLRVCFLCVTCARELNRKQFVRVWIVFESERLPVLFNRGVVVVNELCSCCSREVSIDSSTVKINKQPNRGQKDRCVQQWQQVTPPSRPRAHSSPDD